jgi:hypothetical protein
VPVKLRRAVDLGRLEVTMFGRIVDVIGRCVLTALGGFAG